DLTRRRQGGGGGLGKPGTARLPQRLRHALPVSRPPADSRCTRQRDSAAQTDSRSLLLRRRFLLPSSCAYSSAAVRIRVIVVCGEMLFTCSTSLVPSRPGMTRSVSTRSIPPFLKISSACSPPLHVITR